MAPLYKLKPKEIDQKFYSERILVSPYLNTVVNLKSFHSNCIFSDLPESGTALLNYIFNSNTGYAHIKIIFSDNHPELCPTNWAYIYKNDQEFIDFCASVRVAKNAILFIDGRRFIPDRVWTIISKYNLTIIYTSLKKPRALSENMTIINHKRIFTYLGQRLGYFVKIQSLYGTINHYYSYNKLCLNQFFEHNYSDYLNKQRKFKVDSGEEMSLSKALIFYDYENLRLLL